MPIRRDFDRNSARSMMSYECDPRRQTSTLISCRIPSRSIDAIRNHDPVDRSMPFGITIQSIDRCHSESRSSRSIDAIRNHDPVDRSMPFGITIQSIDRCHSESRSSRSIDRDVGRDSFLFPIRHADTSVQDCMPKINTRQHTIVF